MRTVYLAGPISGLNYDGANDWRLRAISHLSAVGIKGLSPLRAKHYLAPLKSLSGTGEEYAHLGTLSTQKSVTCRDRFDTTKSDMVIMNLLGAKKVSIGTMIEAGWADACRVPIVLVIEPTNIHHHMILREIAGFVVETLDEALDIVKVTLS